ncbi:pectin lyase fold/virulence factor [Jimgerdemannia flammicorona]|uniref:Pectin lyase fold/virulence factor n=1 Tax=Jimgerdemannia flammicorona TaxID=994334 RepID=A0A433Q2V6_9FUNG|nr:pectin lyase fold/virulence factor [Jimgerdemannia flammicorona]
MAPTHSFLKLLSVLALVACVLSFIQVAYAHPVSVDPAAVDLLTGYATLSGNTTGGEGGETVNVITLEDFRKAVAGATPRIVMVSGIIDIGNDVVNVGSYKTILGVGNNSGFTNGGLQILKQTNVIVRNLQFSFSKAPIDLLGLDLSTNIWIDHNEFFNDMDHGKDYYDGQVDITHACDYRHHLGLIQIPSCPLYFSFQVTVSWNRFHDHFKVSLVGHSDANAAQDTGYLKVTYHHNFFYDVNSRLPSIRFGSGHIYNNYFRNADTAVHSRMGAKVLVEYNVFHNVTTAIETEVDSDTAGYAIGKNNNYGGGHVNISRSGGPTIDYTYSFDPTADVVSIVTALSGLGIIA